MKDINELKVLKEYLDYLVELADSIYSHSNITDNDYQSLFVESELFCKRILNANSLPSSLRTQLLELKLPKMKEEFSLWHALKLMKKRDRNHNDKFEIKRRENILIFKERLNGLLLLINAKS